MKNYTAKDIVKVYSELKDLTPDVNDWTEAEFQNSKPRLIRLKQLVAFRKAFKIAGNWDDFEKGKFIKNTPVESYSHLKENIIAFKNTSSWNNQNFDDLNYSDVILLAPFLCLFLIYQCHSKVPLHYPPPLHYL